MTRKWLVFFKFGIVGSLNTIIDFVVYALLTSVGANYLLSQILSYSCGLLNSYFVNRTWTFKQKDKASMKEFIRFLAVNAATLSLTLILLDFLYTKQGLNLLLSKFLVTAIGTIFNFIGTKMLVFTKANTN
ncbi:MULTISPECIES: GtrA family protein [Bacillaceae]|uniref:GtrA family protein n=1 Tax=Bacillaceae TaxID=186817 RepID=UPI001E5D4920|nr:MULTISPECIES: GtrA family protein [Bacillaceae]MCE4050177.1 GtrA family protein [Bacillus sp. Au-Bac7]MCM3029412.1 GtrA family protein [Niallia sp. MER 6]MDL0435284.1 GtrA family protein [Niallia sp. SS-2023]UPO86957.1 GtrA family protein [Niallia sp. Man26]